MLSNSQVLFAHCSTELSYILRRAPFATAHLIDEDLSVDFSKVTTPNDKVAVIAIDDQSIANLGRWPWPRAIHAKIVDILALTPL